MRESERREPTEGCESFVIVDRNLFVKVGPKQHGALSICFSSDDKEMEDCALIKKKINCLAETKIWSCAHYLSFFFIFIIIHFSIVFVVHVCMWMHIQLLVACKVDLNYTSNFLFV